MKSNHTPQKIGEFQLDCEGDVEIPSYGNDSTHLDFEQIEEIYLAMLAQQV